MKDIQLLGSAIYTRWAHLNLIGLTTLLKDWGQSTERGFFVR